MRSVTRTINWLQIGTEHLNLMVFYRLCVSGP